MAELPRREQRFDTSMSDAEALMWNVEKDPWLNPSGGTVIVFDRRPDLDHFRRQLAWAVSEVPRLRERVVASLGRFSPPVWRPDPEFDLDYHVREVALPEPGTQRQLLDLVAAIYQDPYDRTRPLWMFYVIDALEDGRTAMVWKIHHTVADGTGAGRLAEYYLQGSRDHPDPPAVDLSAVVAAAVAAEAEHHRSGVAGLAAPVVDTMTHNLRRQAGMARRAVGEVAMWGADPLRARDAANNVLRTIGTIRGQLLGGGSKPAGGDGDGDDGVPAGSPLWRERSRHRHLEVISHPLEPAIDAARALGGSLNDWFLTGVMIGSIAYHDERGVPLSSLNTSFVVSTRNDRSIGGNSFTPTRVALPAGPMEPGERFAAIHELLAAKRAEVSGGGLLSGLAGVANLLPTSLVTAAARSQAKKQDFATSNLRGGKHPWYLSGAKVVENFPFGPLAGTAFNLTAMSYAGQLDMGLFVDPVAIEAPDELRDHIDEAYHALTRLAKRRRR